MCQSPNIIGQLVMAGTDLVARSAQEPRGSLQSLSIALCALFCDIIARAKLDVRLFEVVFYPTYGN